MAVYKSDKIDIPKLKALMRLKPTLDDTAAFFEVSRRTIERFIRDNFDTTFREFCETYMVHTRLNLIRKAIDKAEKGDNVMLIFCLKNLCGWQNEPARDGGTPVDTSPPPIMTEETALKLVKAARGNK